MCRWMAYSGNPLPLDFLLLEPQHNLIDQSLSATMAPSPTNGDGFGLGFYGRNHEPGTYHSIQPAWNDANLRELAHHIESPLVLAHVRRSTGTPVQQSNCHPFRYAEWLFVHNGLIRGFDRIRRDMAFEIDPSLFHLVKGSTDSELMFFLAVTYGLRDDPVAAMRRVVELIERCAKREGIENALQMTVGLSDGETLWSFRYSTERDSRTLFYSEDMSTLKALYPDDNRAHTEIHSCLAHHFLRMCVVRGGAESRPARRGAPRESARQRICQFSRSSLWGVLGWPGAKTCQSGNWGSRRSPGGGQSVRWDYLISGESPVGRCGYPPG